MRQSTTPSQMILTVDEVTFINEQVEYFNTHDLSEELSNGPEVQMDFSGASSHYYFEVEPELREKLKSISKMRGISAEILLNKWVREKIVESEAVSASK